MVHELGHYTAGRLLKFDIYEFAIGMGPKIFSKKKNGIAYSLRAVPFGGFVAFDDESSITKGELNFHKNPIWKRIIVIIAGPLMNILIAYVLVVIMIAAVGIPTGVLPVVETVTVETPAQEAGLLPGDEFINADGVVIDGNYDNLHNVLQSNQGEAIDFKVAREDQIVDLTIVPKFVEAENRYMLGIYLKQKIETMPFLESLSYGFNYSVLLIKELLSFLFNLVTKGQGAGNVAGPVGSIGIIADTAKTQNFSTLLNLIAFISMNLGVFNLLPIPPLDGSKLILFGVEAVRGKPLSIEKEGMIQMVGFVLFILLAVVLTYKDILKLVSG
jgi:regulator of sigma E protease